METRFKALHAPVDARSVKAYFDGGRLNLEAFDHDSRIVIKIEFDYVDAFSVVEEGFRLDLFDDITTNDGCLFVDELSTYKPWLEKSSKQSRSMTQSRHFIVLLGEEVFDVISPSDPDITGA